MPNPTPVTGPCMAPDCRRQAQTSIRVSGHRMFVCDRCRQRFRRHGYWKPKYRVLADDEVRRGQQLRALGLSTTELAVHFQVSEATANRLFRDVPRRKRRLKP